MSYRERALHVARGSLAQVAAGAWHGMALTEDGEVYTWGHNASGQVNKKARIEN